jgi:hypothetical protein
MSTNLHNGPVTGDAITTGRNGTVALKRLHLYHFDASQTVNLVPVGKAGKELNGGFYSIPVADFNRIIVGYLRDLDYTVIEPETPRQTLERSINEFNEYDPKVVAEKVAALSDEKVALLVKWYTDANDATQRWDAYDAAKQTLGLPEVTPDPNRIVRPYIDEDDIQFLEEDGWGDPYPTEDDPDNLIGDIPTEAIEKLVADGHSLKELLDLAKTVAERLGDAASYEMERGTDDGHLWLRDANTAFSLLQLIALFR